ncbi:MAG: imidazolonepropionase [Halovenus sp.]
MTTSQLLVHSAAELAAVRSDGDAVAGASLDTVEDGAVAVVDGEIAAVGDTATVTREFPPEDAVTVVDASGMTVQPGFVDPHTHAVFAGDRSDEFEAKLRGKAYQEILAEGGGILRTVRATRHADDDTLLANLLDHLDVMLAHGSTTVEVKSGYGLETATELRLLEVIDRADDRHPVDVVPTFMGAHAVPEDRATDEYVDAVIDDQLPAVADQGIAEFCDVFCEEDVFDVDQSRRILEAGADHGLAPKVHAEEFVRLGGAQLAAEVGAASADHLLYANDDDVHDLVTAGTVPVLLPGTAFGLGTAYADARGMLDAGAPVALATDFNPNCYAHSMGFATTLGCVGMQMTPAESLVAATRNAARAVDRADGRGVLQPGTPADLCLLDAPSHVHVPYTFGVNRVHSVVKDGEVVHERG